MGVFKSIDRATVNGHEIDVHTDSLSAQIRLYVDGELRDMKTWYGGRYVLLANLDGKKLEVQIRQRLLGFVKSEVWAVWDGGHIQFRQVE